MIRPPSVRIARRRRGARLSHGRVQCGTSTCSGGGSKRRRYTGGTQPDLQALRECALCAAAVGSASIAVAAVHTDWRRGDGGVGDRAARRLRGQAVPKDAHDGRRHLQRGEGPRGPKRDAALLHLMRQRAGEGDAAAQPAPVAGGCLTALLPGDAILYGGAARARARALGVCVACCDASHGLVPAVPWTRNRGKTGRP